MERKGGKAGGTREQVRTDRRTDRWTMGARQTDRCMDGQMNKFRIESSDDAQRSFGSLNELTTDGQNTSLSMAEIECLHYSIHIIIS